MKHTWRNLNSNRIMNRKYAKNYRHIMNIITFLKSNYKYKRRSPRCRISNKHQWYLPYRQQKPNQKHKLPASEEAKAEDKQITKKISFYENIRLDKFLRIFVLIIQQATSRYINSNIKNNINNFSKSKSDNDRLVKRLIVKMKAVNNANKIPLENLKERNKYEDGIEENHRAYKNANTESNININDSNNNDEISHQQHNYDKVSTITSTLIKCQRRKHHQLKATNSSSSQLSQSPTISFTTTMATSKMDTLLSTPSIANYESCQCTAILHHYVCEHPSTHHHQYYHKPKPNNQHHNHHTPRINSLVTSGMLNIKSSNNNNNTIINSRGITPSATGIRTSIQSTDQYGNAGCNRSYTLSCLLLTLFIAFAFSIRSTTAGACWQTVLDNGKCNEIFSLNISKSECCGANQEFAYTKREPTNVEYFFATAIGGGMECSPCLESCMNVKCGPNKKCVKRKGRPKCVCAPECGAGRRKRKHMELLRQQKQQPQHESQHYTLRLVSSHDKEDKYKNVPSAIRSPKLFNIKLEKSQQSRDTRSLSSEITNINLGLRNGKDAMINSDVTAPVERHYCKDYNQNQRKLIHMQMQHYNSYRQQQQYTHQINHEKQEPKGSRRVLIIANAEHTEKPTTRRLQIFSNVRTTQARRQYSSNKKNKYGQAEDTDLSAYDEENSEDYNYNDAEDDAKKKSGIIDIGNSNKNNRNNDSKRFLNQSPSRRKLKTNKNPNNKNNKNKNRNKNHHDLQTTKIQQHFNKNHTRVIHSQQNGRHTANTSIHRHHNHSNHQHQQQQQQQQQRQKQQESRHNNHQQQSQNYGRHKHNNENKHHKQHSLVLKKPKNNKDYNITTTSNNTNIAVVNIATTTTTTTAAITKDRNLSNSSADVTAIDATFSTLLQTRMVKITTTTTPTPTLLNLSSSSAEILPITTTLNISPQDTQQQLLPSYITSSTTPLNSAMSADDDDAAADDHYHSRLRNHGSKIATSSLLSATSSSSSSSHSQLFAVSARSSSELSVATTMSAKGEGVSFHDHDDRTEIQAKTTHNDKNNNDDDDDDDIISALQSNLHNNQQQDQQLQTQPQSPQRFHTPMFDSISEQFDLIGFPNNKQQQVTNDDNSKPLNPVCGTDGRTYNTECQLKKRACRTDNPNLQISYLGHCRTTCNGVKCLNGLTCVEDQYSMPHCIACKIECPYDDYDNNVVDATRAVCGADGKTYKSACDINRMICKIGRSIGVAYPGPCRDIVIWTLCKFQVSTYNGSKEDQVTCDDINCGPKQLCLIDLLTHKPRCTSCRYKCSRKRRPSSSHFDEGKICGFNNRTYNSWCEMRKDSCSTGFYIDVMYSGDCQ